MTRFQIILRSCALPPNLAAWCRRFSGLIPPEKLCPSVLPEGLVRGGAVCSLELSDLSGLLFALPRSGASPSGPSLPVLSPLLSSRREVRGTSRACDKIDSAFPLTGRRPVWPFSRLHDLPLGNPTPRGVFFPLEARRLLRSLRSFSLRVIPIPPTGR